MGIKPTFSRKGCKPWIHPAGKESPGCEPPYSLDHPKVIKICEWTSSAKDDSGDLTKYLRKLLKGIDGLCFSQISLPFISRSSVKGIYLLVGIDCPKHLSIIFTHGDTGLVSVKEYDFDKPRMDCAWYYLPVDLENVIKCKFEVEDEKCWDGEFWPAISGIRIIRCSDLELEEIRISKRRKDTLEDSAYLRTSHYA
ncbi:hypothetical protein ADUPG1_013488 [Aduncisulcus paluster]|uniref:Uncharacterized protein n=1 Tax=Aduncisulcus paluster TaxID=2918883 RepID=A0ABQ5K767_9EUKA|nr:hypothetical protein ADUPG1_013488 [Aduncisulcus paluster]